MHVRKPHALPGHRTLFSRAFTLIELLVVMVILVVLLTIAIPAYLRQQHEARVNKEKQYLSLVYRSARAAAVSWNQGNGLLLPVPVSSLVSIIAGDQPQLEIGTASDYLKAVFQDDQAIVIDGDPSDGTGTSGETIVAYAKVNDNKDIWGVIGGPSGVTYMLMGSTYGAPENTSPPAISGNYSPGQTLTATTGTWTGTGNSYGYQWQRSTDNTTWTNISSANANTYTLATADIGDYVRVAVSAANSYGVNIAFSPTTSGSGSGGQKVSAVPVGSLVAWTGSTVPSGWALADGSCGYSSTTDPDLYAAIGTTYGGSSSNFCLPDMRGEMALGKASSGLGSSLGQTGGVLDQSGTLTPWGTVSESYSWSETPSNPPPVADTASIPSGPEALSNNQWPNFTTWAAIYASNPPNCCGTDNWRVDSLSTTTETWTAGTVSGLTASASVTPTASYSVSNPPFSVVRYIISIAPGVAPCGALWGYGGASTPGGAQMADGSSTTGSLSSCVDSAFAGKLPDLRGSTPIAVAATGSASSLGGAGGSIDQTVNATLAPAATQASVTPGAWNDTLTEGSETPTYNGAQETSGSGGNAMGSYGASNTPPTVSQNSNAGAVYTSNSYSPGPLAASGAGAQTPASSSFSLPFQVVNWLAYTTSSYAPTAGSITAFAGSSAPTGWLLADGSCYATGTYSTLFSAIGYTYGGSGGSFCVPDLRGRFPLGKASSGTGSSLAASGGSLSTSKTVTFNGWTPSITIPAHSLSWTVPSHTYTVTWHGSNSLGNAGGFIGYVRSPGTGTSGAAGGGVESGAVSSYSVNGAAVGSAAPSVSVSPPPFVAVNYVIKT